MTTQTKVTLIDFTHAELLKTHEPKGYDCAKHRPLKMDDFDPSKDNYLFHKYKSQIHLPYYANTTIGDRIKYHKECVAIIDDPTTAAKMQMDKTINVFIKQTGKTRPEVIALLKNA